MTTSPCDLKTTSSRNSREDDRDMGGQEEFSVRVFSSTDWGSQFPTRSVVCVPIPISTLSLAAMAEIHKVNYSKLVWLRPPQPVWEALASDPWVISPVRLRLSERYTVL